MITKLLTVLAFLLIRLPSFGQWTRVQQLPATNIFTLYHKDNILYAGGRNTIYISRDNGLSWDSTAALPLLSQQSIIDNIIVYKNELYASSPSKNIFKSLDGGNSWQNISAGIDTLATVHDFCEFRGDLYAATEGNLGSPMFKLDPVNRTHWLSFSTGLSSLSTNLNSIIGTSTTLIAGTNNNALYDYLAPNSSTWEERFLSDPPFHNEGAFDIITAHDTLFLAGKTGFFYTSMDNGFTWNFFGSRLVTGATFIVNAKQALISSRYIFNDVTNNNTTLFYYIKKDSLQHAFNNFSVVANHFTWKIDIVADKLWDASDHGLFYMSLSGLPGISAADDSVMDGPLPLRFISFNTNCQTNKVALTWQTDQEQNVNHFNIERSSNGLHWNVIGSRPAKGNDAKNNYFFADSTPVENCYYRIAEYDHDGRHEYSSTMQSSCNIKAGFNQWPNPVSNLSHLSITTNKASKVTITLYDHTGALVTYKEMTLLKGNNRLSIDMSFLPKGYYSLSASWNNNENRQSVMLLKD